MALIDEIRIKKAALEMLARRYGFGDIRIFGSALYAEEDPKDIDLLVDVPLGHNGLGVVQFGEEASELLRIKVDVVRADRIYPPLKKNILSQAQLLEEIRLMPGKKPPKNYMVYVDHMLEYIESIGRYAKQSGADYFEHDMVKEAILFNLEKTIENAKKLSDDWKASEPSIDWKAMTGFRDILVHDYEGRFDPKVAKAVIEKELPPLKEALVRMKARYGEGNDHQ